MLRQLSISMVVITYYLLSSNPLLQKAMHTVPQIIILTFAAVNNSQFFKCS